MKKAILFLFVFCQSLLIGTVLNAQVFIGLDIQSECEPATVNFLNNSDVGTVGPEVWTWDINGMIYNDYEVTGLILPAGFYDVSLVLYDSLGYVDEDYTSFEIYPDLSTFGTSSGGEACPGEPMQFWFDDRISPYDLLWTFGDNSVTEDQHRYNYPTHTFYEAGVYDVTLVIDHYCGPDTIVQQVNIGGSAKPDVHAYISNGPDFCPNDPVVFDVEGEYPSYLWNFGDGETSTMRRPQHVYPAETATTYTATVTVTNPCGNSDTDTLLVTFTDDLEADAGFDFYYDSYYTGYPCPNSPVEFFAWGAGIYEWDFGDGSFSNEQKATNYYTKPGKYYVTLTVWNGCGDMDSRLDSIEVMLDPMDIPYADFYFEIEGIGEDEDWSDTITVCPNMLINYRNQSWSYSGAGMTYLWDFGDGATALTKDAYHYYTAASPTPYEVSLVARSSCGGTDTIRKYVRVDAGLMPEHVHGVTPTVICDGEEVYFYVNEGIEENLYTFDIDFGDGTPPLTNATTWADSVLQTLANHVYTGAAGDTFNYVFSVTNQCGNTLDQTGTIRITDDPGIKPFYYVSNTTTSMEVGAMQDWSFRRDDSDHELLIHFVWPGWPMTQDKFAVFFWYEGFYPEGDPGPAHGYVEFHSPGANYGDSVTAYIPMDPSHGPIVGFAVGWTCDGVYKQGVEPEVWGMQFDFLGMPVEAIPIEPYGFTNMSAIGYPVELDADASWDGLCNDQRPGRNYYYQLNAGQYIQLTFDRDNDEYYLYATKDKEGYDYITDISYGDYYLISPTEMQLTDWYECVEMTGTYQFTISGDSLQLIMLSDGCTNRIKYLTDTIFMKKPDFGGEMYSRAACPGDKVQFTIAGGASYEWHFGDGSPLSSENYPIHIYADPGDYEAFVIATNNCGRTDTIYTPVKIVTDNPPMAYFWWEGYDHSRLESIQFNFSDDWSDQVGNNTYLWNFGDGTTSTEMNPVHAYERDGEYIISLTVTNNCGSTTETQWIYIRDAILACEAKIGIDSIVGRKVYFQDISRGTITNWFWDFGDGFTSGEQDPVYTYNYDGVFFVCLSVYDSINNCAHQICRRVQIGTQNCVADFGANVNTTTNKVQFTDLSTNATEWFWDFGDGSFSDLKDPVHAYTEPGWYYVCLSIYNDASDCFAYRCKEVQVGEEDPTLCYADFSYFVDEATNTVRFTDASSAGITNWYWTFGDGTYREERSPVKTYKGPGIYEVCLIVFDKNTGCSDEICMEIPVGVSECNLRADFAFFVDITNSVATFNDRTGGQPTKWFWNFGDGGTSSKQNPKHQYTEPGYYLVTLSVMDDKDCKDHMAEFIQIGAVDCRAAFEYKVDAATRNVQFYNKSTGSSPEYFWDFDDGTFSDEKDPVHQFSKPGIYFVSLTLISGDGMCVDFFYEPIQVGTVDCAAKFKYFIDSATNVAYFTPEEIGSATAYLWYFGDGAIATGKTAQHRFNQPGYFTVGLNTFDETTGCMDYWEDVILIGSAGSDCRAGFSYVSDPATKTVKFGDRSKGMIVEYIWDFGDGSPIGSTKNPTHTYVSGGYYLVCLTVVNNFGIPNTFCDYVQIATTDEERCFADFFFSIDSVTKTVEFMQQSHGNPDGFLWNFDDGETSAEENPEHTYSEAGYYMVGLSIMNSTTNCSSRRYKLINVSEGNRGLRADFSYEIDSSNLKADTYPVDFVGVSLGDAGKLKWTFGDGTSDTTTMNPTHVYTVPGIYTACLIISNPITEDADTSCQDVTTPGYGVGIDPEAAWSEGIGNYPNPFDRMTTIVYDLLGNTRVDLTVFDQTGRMVDILVREDQPAGRYQLEYDGSNLDSGIYILRLSTNLGVYTARMVVR